jgi:hypothetical protein
MVMMMVVMVMMIDGDDDDDDGCKFYNGNVGDDDGDDGNDDDIKVEVKSVCKQTVCLHFELLYFLKYDVLSEYLTPLWFTMLLNEYEIEFMFRKIRNIRNLGNVSMRGSSHCYEQNRCAEQT